MMRVFEKIFDVAAKSLTAFGIYEVVIAILIHEIGFKPSVMHGAMFVALGFCCVVPSAIFSYYADRRGEPS